MTRGRPVVTLCPRCKARPKAIGPSGYRQAYCRPCHKAYAAYRYRKGFTKKVVNIKSDPLRRLLGLRDGTDPSETYIEAYCGWGVDRFATRAYRISGRESEVTTQLYLIGHQAVKRFWEDVQGTGWEMGPDSSEFVDGQWGSRSMLKGYRFASRNPNPRKQVR